MHVVEALVRVLLDLYATHRVSAVFLLVLIEEAGIPIPVPGDTLVMLAGAAPQRSIGYDVTVIGLCSLAVFMGSSALYSVARHGGRALLDKYGKYIRLNRRRLDRMERWFLRRGKIAIVLGRLIPGLRIPTTIIAGLSDVPYRVYAPTAAVAAVIWSLFYFFAGVALQHEWGLITSLVSGALDEISGSVIWLRVAIFVFSIVLSGGTWHLSRRLRAARIRRAHAPTAGRDGLIPAALGAREVLTEADAPLG